MGIIRFLGSFLYMDSHKLRKKYVFFIFLKNNLTCNISIFRPLFSKHLKSLEGLEVVWEIAVCVKFYGDPVKIGVRPRGDSARKGLIRIDRGRLDRLGSNRP